MRKKILWAMYWIEDADRLDARLLFTSIACLDWMLCIPWFGLSQFWQVTKDHWDSVRERWKQGGGE